MPRRPGTPTGLSAPFGPNRRPHRGLPATRYQLRISPWGVSGHEPGATGPPHVRAVRGAVLEPPNTHRATEPHTSWRRPGLIPDQAQRLQASTRRTRTFRPRRTAPPASIFSAPCATHNCHVVRLVSLTSGPDRAGVEHLGRRSGNPRCVDQTAQASPGHRAAPFCFHLLHRFRPASPVGALKCPGTHPVSRCWSSPGPQTIRYFRPVVHLTNRPAFGCDENSARDTRVVFYPS